MTARATVSVARLGAADVVRRYVPWQIARRALGALLAALFVLLVAGAALIPLPASGPPAGGGSVGFAVFVAAFALPVAVLGAIEAVRSGTRTRVLLAAPLGPGALLGALFLPSLLLVAVPVLFLYSPFAVVLLRHSVGGGVLFLSAGVVSALAATVAGVAVVTYAASVLGRERGVSVASLAALGLLIGTSSAAPFLVRLSLTPALTAAALVTSVVALVPWARSVGRRLVEVAGVPPPARAASEPAWGALRPWALVARSGGSGGLAVVAVLFAFFAWGPDSLERTVALGALALTAAGLPAGLAMAGYHDRPDLLRSAPGGRRLAARTVLQVSGPAVLVVLAVLALVAGGAWAVGVGALVVVFPFTHLVLSLQRRRIAQVALLLASCILAFL